MVGEWFRSPNWSEDAREEFEQRLRRARPYNRAQYLHIKGLALAEAGELEAARELWLRVLDSTEELAQFQQPGALEHVGDSYVTDDPALADHYYRRLLAKHPTRSGTAGVLSEDELRAGEAEVRALAARQSQATSQSAGSRTTPDTVPAGQPQPSRPETIAQAVDPDAVPGTPPAREASAGEAAPSGAGAGAGAD